MKFWLGVHRPGWLADAGVPLCVSRKAFYAGGRERRVLPRAAAPWILDSGAFSEFNNPPHCWTITPAEYARFARRCRDEVGMLAWAAPMDGMCEAWILRKASTSVAAQQHLTVANYLELRSIAPELPVPPVLQGWTRDDYLRCVDLYLAAGIDLHGEPLVGLGSVCRRSDTMPAEQIVRALAPLRLHGFGVKTDGLSRYGWRLTSSDSLAWSIDARWDAARTARPPRYERLPDCAHAGRSCANCLPRGLWWRQRLIAKIEKDTRRGRQLELLDDDEITALSTDLTTA